MTGATLHLIGKLGFSWKIAICAGPDSITGHIYAYSTTRVLTILSFNRAVTIIFTTKGKKDIQK